MTPFVVPTRNAEICHPFPMVCVQSPAGGDCGGITLEIEMGIPPQSDTKLASFVQIPMAPPQSAHASQPVPNWLRSAEFTLWELADRPNSTPNWLRFVKLR